MDSRRAVASFGNRALRGIWRKKLQIKEIWTSNGPVNPPWILCPDLMSSAACFNSDFILIYDRSVTKDMQLMILRRFCRLMLPWTLLGTRKWQAVRATAVDLSCKPQKSKKNRLENLDLSLSPLAHLVTLKRQDLQRLYSPHKAPSRTHQLEANTTPRTQNQIPRSL